MGNFRLSRFSCINRLAEEGPRTLGSTRHQDAPISRAGLAHAVLADAVTM